MSRVPFAVLSLVLAAAALADTPAQCDDATGISPKPRTAVASSGGVDAVSANRGQAKGRGSIRFASARWHSLVPGMFR